MVREFVTGLVTATVLSGAGFSVGGHLAPYRVAPNQSPAPHHRVAPNQSPHVVYACVDPSTNRITEASAPIAGQVCENETTNVITPVASSARTRP
jgi:hypothetical protein